MQNTDEITAICGAIMRTPMTRDFRVDASIAPIIVTSGILTANSTIINQTRGMTTKGARKDNCYSFCRRRGLIV